MSESKKPREFWIKPPDRCDLGEAYDSSFPGLIHVREVTDEIRVSRKDFEILKGFIMFESHAMSDAQAIIERIEQESK